MSSLSSISVSAAQSYASVGTQGQQSLQPFANVNLSEAQRTALRNIFTTAKQAGTTPADVRQQVNAVLTPAQQQTLASDFKAGKSGHHHRSDAELGTQTAATPAASTAATAASSDETVLGAVTNIQNQAAAAQSTLIANLQKNLLATGEESTPT